MNQVASSPLVLDDECRDYLRRLVEADGLAPAAKKLDISRSVVSSAVAGIPIRRGSIELLRAAIARHREENKTK